MFNNMGRKIKTLAKVLCWINIAIGILGALGGIVSGLAAGNASHNGSISVIVPFLCLLGAAIWVLLAWIGSFMLCGYGELIENTAITAQNTQKLIEMKSYELNQNAANNVKYDTPNTSTQI